MSNPFLGEIRIFPFAFAPQGWARCDGQLLPLSQNSSLHLLLGTMYGGDGQTTFALPDLRGRAATHAGKNFPTQGESGGEEVHTLTTVEMPQHQHSFLGVNNHADQSFPDGALLAGVSNMYTSPQNLTTMHPATVTEAGKSEPHDNMQPYLALNFCVALIGTSPTKS